VKRLALVCALMLAGCAGGAEPDRDARATLVVTIRTDGALSTEAFTVEGGRLKPGELDEARVYARAGDEEPEEGISFEEIYFVEPVTEPRRLTRDRHFDHSPSLSRDGRVVFVSCPLPPGTELPSCSLDAIEPRFGERRTIAHDLGFVWVADLAPDEGRLLLSRVGEALDPGDVVVRDLDSGDEHRVGPGGFGRWSPDGDQIAFVSDRDRNGRCLFHDCAGFAGEIYVMDASGEGDRRLTKSPAHDAAVEWSGDGEWILFGRIPDEEDDWDLWAVRADGECELQLTDTDRWRSPPSGTAAATTDFPARSPSVARLRSTVPPRS
jgi:Tol biopolymer transport system component